MIWEVMAGEKVGPRARPWPKTEPPLRTAPHKASVTAVSGPLKVRITPPQERDR